MAEINPLWDPSMEHRAFEGVPFPIHETPVNEERQEEVLPHIDIDTEERKQRYEDYRAVQLAHTTTRIAEVRGLLAQFNRSNPKFDVGGLTIDNQFLKGMGKVAEAQYNALSETGERGHKTARTIVEFNKPGGIE